MTADIFALRTGRGGEGNPGGSYESGFDRS